MSPGDPAADAYVALLRAAAAAAADVNRRLAARGLTASRFRTLCSLKAADGPLCPRDIAGCIGQTRGNVTMILDDLERRGLVERRREGINRRFRAVHLTARGRRTLASIAPRQARAVAEAMRPLTAKELRLLAGLCRRLERR